MEFSNKFIALEERLNSLEIQVDNLRNDFPQCPYCKSRLVVSKGQRADMINIMWDCPNCEIYIGDSEIGTIYPLRIG